MFISTTVLRRVSGQCRGRFVRKRLSSFVQMQLTKSSHFQIMGLGICGLAATHLRIPGMAHRLWHDRNAKTNTIETTRIVNTNYNTIELSNIVLWQCQNS